MGKLVDEAKSKSRLIQELGEARAEIARLREVRECPNPRAHLTRATITIAETKNGELKCTVAFDPPVRKGKDGKEVPHAAGSHAMAMLNALMEKHENSGFRFRSAGNDSANPSDGEDE